MKLNFSEVKPYVRFASVVERNKDYSDFLYAYDYRLFYMLSGEIQFQFNNKIVDIRDGDLIIFPPGTAYKIKYKNANGAKYIILNFDFDYKASKHREMPPAPANTFDISKIISKAYFPPFDEIFTFRDTSDIEEIITKIISEIDNRDKYSSEAASSLMKQLLIEILRYTYSPSPKGVSSKLSNEVKKYIELNYTDNITNISIAKHFNYHPYYLNSVFVKHTGITLHNYITKTRLNNARKLLLCTDSSICEIAKKCGFSNQSYFSECFKSAFTISPTEYRNQAW